MLQLATQRAVKGNSEMPVRARWRMATVLASVALASSLTATPAAAEATPTVDCTDVRIPLPTVATDASGSTLDEWHVEGELCVPEGAARVEVLLSGGTYGSEYWDFGFQPETYSYVNFANDRRVATFNYDRLGMGESSKPDPTLLTFDTHVDVVYRIVKSLRDGSFGWKAQRVVLVGHSFGSAIAVSESSMHQDVDAVVLTGLSHFVARVPVEVMSAWYPARLDPNPRFNDLHPGWLTSRPGARDVFYYLPNTDPAVLAHDEATKETVSLGFVAGVRYAAETAVITPPVLTVLGEKDQLMCPVSQCSDPHSVARLEGVFYPLLKSYDLKFIPDAAHNLALQRNAQEFFRVMHDWINSIIAGGASGAPIGSRERD